jgi:hypothetical protein
MAGSTVFAAWKNHYTLTEEQAQKVKNGGIEYRVWISGTTAYVYLDGQQVCAYDLSVVVATGQPSGIDKATVTVHLRMDGNIGKKVEVPFKLVQTDTATEPETPTQPETPIDPSKLVTLNIGTIANGTITPGKTAYAVGDTVTLTITPASGYAQKLTINGKPLMVDWKTNTYSFVATEKNYVIGGSFVKSISTTASDTTRWDAANQAYGVVKTYYPYENESWWFDINGNYKSLSVKVKNYLSLEDSKDGNGKVGFAFVLRINLDNGKFYAFRIINDKGTYAHDHFGASGSSSGWGNWKNIHSLADAINGDGVDYKIERTGANTLTLSINGEVVETYTMDGVTAANKVVSVGVRLYGNQGQTIDVPFQVEEEN